jgi:hypothetical protein
MASQGEIPELLDAGAIAELETGAIAELDAGAMLELLEAGAALLLVAGFSFPPEMKSSTSVTPLFT